MRKRLKYYLALLVFMFLAAGAVGIIYNQARKKSNEQLTQFNEKHAESMSRAEQLLHQAAAISSPAPTITIAPATPPAQPPAPARQRVNILQEMNKWLRSSSSAGSISLNVSESHPYLEIKLGDKDTDSSGTLLPSGQKIIQDRLQRHLSSTAARQAAQREARAKRQLDDKGKEPSESSVARRLDQFETLLLDCDWDLPEFNELRQFRFNFSPFDYWFRLALLRELGQGKAERAASLFIKGHCCPK